MNTNIIKVKKRRKPQNHWGQFCPSRLPRKVQPSRNIEDRRELYSSPSHWTAVDEQPVSRVTAILPMQLSKPDTLARQVRWRRSISPALWLGRIRRCSRTIWTNASSPGPSGESSRSFCEDTSRFITIDLRWWRGNPPHAVRFPKGNGRSGLFVLSIWNM